MSQTSCSAVAKEARTPFKLTTFDAVALIAIFNAKRSAVLCRIYSFTFWSWNNEDLPLVELMYPVFTRMPGERYRRRLRSLLLYLCCIFQELINCVVCWLRAWIWSFYTYSYQNCPVSSLLFSQFLHWRLIVWVSSVGEVYCTKRREAVRYVTKLGVGEISMYLLFIYLITVTNSQNLSPAYKHTQRSITASQLSQNRSPT